MHHVKLRIAQAGEPMPRDLEYTTQGAELQMQVQGEIGFQVCKVG